MALGEEQVYTHHLGIHHLDALLRPEQRGRPPEDVGRDQAARGRPEVLPGGD